MSAPHFIADLPAVNSGSLLPCLYPEYGLPGVLNSRAMVLILLPKLTCVGYCPAEYADKNQAVAQQRLTGSHAYWKWHAAYNRGSVAETAMYRVKQLFGGHLTFRDYDAQLGEAMAMIRALKK